MEFRLWLFVIKKLAQTYEMSNTIYDQMSEDSKKALFNEYQKSGLAN